MSEDAVTLVGLNDRLENSLSALVSGVVGSEGVSLRNDAESPAHAMFSRPRDEDFTNVLRGSMWNIESNNSRKTIKCGSGFFTYNGWIFFSGSTLTTSIPSASADTDFLYIAVHVTRNSRTPSVHLALKTAQEIHEETEYGCTSFPIGRMDFFHHTDEQTSEEVMDGFRVTQFPTGVIHFFEVDTCSQLLLRT